MKNKLLLGVLASLASTVTVATDATGTGNTAMQNIAITSDASYVNAATALLYRWWGLVEGPPGTDISPYFADLFADDVHVKMTNIDVTGIDKVRAGFAAIPKGNVTAHHVRSIEVTNLGAGNFRLQAEFVYQTLQADGVMRSGEGFYDHRIKLRPDGEMIFTKINARLGNKVDMGPFQSTYIDHRARAVIQQFQAVLDANNGSGARLAELVKPDAIFANLLAPSADAKLDKWDQTLHGPKELAAWADQGPKLFKSVSHNKLEIFKVRAIGGGRYEAIAQFDFLAATHSGKWIEKHEPRTWILHDEGGKYMRIEKLL